MSYEKKGSVSLWVFREQEEPADAGKDVLHDFAGIDCYDLDDQEATFSKSYISLRDLINRLSFSSSFVDQATTAAKELGIENALGVIAQYDFAYDPKKVRRPIRRDPMFLGFFNWHE